MNNAIVCLTRGYVREDFYHTLIERNRAIKEFINKENQYPLVIFHEGNIPQQHQDYIVKHSEGQDIRFVDISPVWVGGYESMCRFQAYHLWNYSKEFDYIMRIDEDCIITKCETDPFSMIGENVYLKSVYFDESHSETNATLPPFIESLTGASSADFYNRKFVYTNVSVSSTAFWLEPSMNELLAKISLCDDQLKNRWGDLPILGSLLNMYAKGKVGTLTGLSYYHGTHDMTINCE